MRVSPFTEQATGGVKQTEDGVELMLFVKQMTAGLYQFQ